MHGPPENHPQRVPGSDSRARQDSVEARPLLLVVLGPTGTGKSELAFRLAERFDGELIGCDALQVYRGFDVGTAKPPLEFRKRIPHHLVGEIDPREDFTLADFVRMAEQAIVEIVRRGRLPVVVGGTGLYLRGLLLGIVDAPPRDPALRRRLYAMAERRGSTRLHRWLSSLDRGSALRIAPGDIQRLVRALELALRGDTVWSERLRHHGTWREGRERYRTLKIGLDAQRDVLARRLDARVERFFAEGLVAEVRSLLASGVPPTANAFKAIGYREVLKAITTGRRPETVRADVQRHTRRYAKRQRTWFRKEPDVIWLDAAEAGLVEEAERMWLNFVGDTP